MGVVTGIAVGFALLLSLILYSCRDVFAEKGQDTEKLYR